MEVHHHPQLHHEKKPWKEYFLEFLMIFLAVFMGFIAENIRESIVEKNRAKEYMKEMVHNLEYDTVRCRVNTEANLNLTRGIDSFRTELKQAIAGNINSNRLYYFFVKYGNGNNIGQAVFNTSAMTELRSSGSLRLIANQELIGDIADYYDRRLFAANTFIPREQQNELGKVSKGIFSWVYYDDFLDVAGKLDKHFTARYDYKRLLLMTPSPKLLKTDIADLAQFYNVLCDMEAGIKYYDSFLSDAKTTAMKLIGSIRDNYNLKDE